MSDGHLVGPADSARESAEAKSRRVLVVDDNVDSATSLARVLGLWGHEVWVAHGGPEAIEIAAARRPDVVLLDIGMPGMDGYQVAEHLRNHPEAGTPTLFALTGYGQEEDRRRSHEVGIEHHFVKPVDLDELQAALARGASRPG
jgi:two-component system CheB/CheR fusion protein